jgi:hypothetical protein
MPPTRPRWLLLIVALPPSASRPRVRVWRRRRQAGAVAVRRSVYALPDRPARYDAFRAIAAEVATVGGEAALFRIRRAENLSDAALDRFFRRGRGR